MPPGRRHRRQQEQDRRGHQAETDEAVLGKELEIVVVHVGAADGLDRLQLLARHLRHAEVLVTPAPAAEEEVVLPDLHRHADVVLPLPGHPHEDLVRVQRADLVPHVVRHGLHGEEHDQPRDRERDRPLAHALRPRHPAGQREERVEEIDGCQRDDKDDRRPGQGVDRGEEEHERRNEKRVAAAERAVPVLLHGRGIRLVQRVDLVVRPAPQRHGDAEERDEIAARHVLIAKRREKPIGRPELRDRLPERPWRADDGLQKAEKRQGEAVPDDELHHKTLSPRAQAVPDGHRKDQHDREIDEHVIVVMTVHAIRQELERRLRIVPEGNQRSVAAGAKPVVQEGNRQQDEQSDCGPHERVSLHRPPDAFAGLVRRLHQALLRKRDDHLRRQQQQPGHDRLQHVGTGAAEQPCQERNDQGDVNRREVIVDEAHVRSPFRPPLPRSPCPPAFP